MKIAQHTDLHVYQKAFDAAMLIFEASKGFPRDETYSLTDLSVSGGLPVSPSPRLPQEDH